MTTRTKKATTRSDSGAGSLISRKQSPQQFQRVKPEQFFHPCKLGTFRSSFPQTLDFTAHDAPGIEAFDDVAYRDKRGQTGIDAERNRHRGGHRRQDDVAHERRSRPRSGVGIDFE